MRRKGVKCIMNEINLKELSLNDYPLRTYDKIRYCDTDRQGHVNNAVFSSLLETGRVELLYNPVNPLASPGGSFVIASLKLDFFSELQWPGKVEIGTGVIKVGNSSVKLVQGLYQEGKLAATAETVIVQTDKNSGGSKPLISETKGILRRYLLERK